MDTGSCLEAPGAGVCGQAKPCTTTTAPPPAHPGGSSSGSSAPNPQFVPVPASSGTQAPPGCGGHPHPLGAPSFVRAEEGGLPSPPGSLDRSPTQSRAAICQARQMGRASMWTGKNTFISWDGKGRSCKGGRLVEWARVQPCARGHPVPPPCPRRESWEANKRDTKARQYHARAPPESEPGVRIGPYLWRRNDLSGPERWSLAEPDL